MTQLTVTIRGHLLPDDTTQAAELLFRLGWSAKVDPEATERRLRGATWFALAVVDRRVVGFVRALSDGIAVTYIAELGVAPEVRRRGIGSLLLSAAVAEFRETVVHADASLRTLPVVARAGIVPRSLDIVECASRQRQ
ncbi:GNAT family N-acetyltransferase [Roseomonas sp. CCTCC AB2023176]|uniref:GNAT family N-acetyltransferase n=1 Tax=Roseomonas sp. CCTCC AB2023176 TaxID=3342640 RepID=UPI0035E04307